MWMRVIIIQNDSADTQFGNTYKRAEHMQNCQRDIQDRQIKLIDEKHLQNCQDTCPSTHYPQSRQAQYHPICGDHHKSDYPYGELCASMTTFAIRWPSCPTPYY